MMTDCLFLSILVCWQWLANPFCRRLFRHFCFPSTSTEPMYSLYCNYAKWTLVIVSGSEHVMLYNQHLNKANKMKLCHDDLSLCATTTANSSQTVFVYQISFTWLWSTHGIVFAFDFQWCHTLWLSPQDNIFKRFTLTNWPWCNSN